jgi:hypothetical protein
MQEYLAASLFNSNDEDLMVTNFYDNWWLNTNIFYAGKTPHVSNVLVRIGELKENFPLNEDAKLAFIIHGSKVLQAAHLMGNIERLAFVQSMVKIFDSMLKDSLADVITQNENRLKKRTILEMILWSRKLFCEFFGSSQFVAPLEATRLNLLKSEHALTDITEYCISFCLATKKHDSTPLYELLIHKKNLNPRWFKIIDVDVKIKNLKVSNKKISSKFKSHAFQHKDYIKKQFRERLEKHYSSITGIS